MATNSKLSQVELVRLSMKSKIARAILLKLASVPGLRTYAFDHVRLLTSDFNDLETPAVQLIDIAETVIHEHVRAEKTWRLLLELVLKENEHGQVSQEDLWNFTLKIERILWAVPNLGIPGVIQLTYLGNSTDLHRVKPYYLSKLDFDVVYYEDLVADC